MNELNVNNNNFEKNRKNAQQYAQDNNLLLNLYKKDIDMNGARMKEHLMMKLNTELEDDLEFLIEREITIQKAIDEAHRVYNEKVAQKKYNLFIAINKL